MKKTLMFTALLAVFASCDNNINDNKGDKEAPTEQQDRNRHHNEDGETKELDKDSADYHEEHKD